MSAGVEVMLWLAIFHGIDRGSLAGFSKENYLAYSIWAAFVSRITSNWQYEFRMIEEIETGSINTILTRPISFFEYYLSQFLGYKFVTSLISLVFPLGAVMLLGLPTVPHRIPFALLLAGYHLVLVHCISFCVSSLAFRLNRATGFTVAKNLCLWMLSGELFPLDLFPGFWRNIMVNQPFANAVYIPVGFLTGRLDSSYLLRGVISNTLGLIFFGALGAALWQRGLRSYSGTGA